MANETPPCFTTPTTRTHAPAAAALTDCWTAMVETSRLTPRVFPGAAAAEVAGNCGAAAAEAAAPEAAAGGCGAGAGGGNDRGAETGVTMPTAMLSS